MTCINHLPASDAIDAYIASSDITVYIIKCHNKKIIL